MRLACLALVCVPLACVNSTNKDQASSADDEAGSTGESGPGGGGVTDGTAATGGSTSGGGAAMGGAAMGGAAMDGAGTNDAGADATASIPNPFVYISGYDSQIRIFELDVETGTLMARGMADGGPNPSYLAWTPDRKYIYAANERADGRVTAFSINGATGALTRINDATSGGNAPAHISVHNGGKHVFAANYSSGHVTVLPILANGGLGTPLDTQTPVPRNAHQIVGDVAGKFVFVPATGPNLVAQFSFDAATGKLAPVIPATVPGATVGNLKQEPRHIAFHPNQKNAYVVNERGMSVTSYSYDATAGRLSTIETVSAIPVPTSGGSGAHIVVHPGGRFVYASMRGHNSIAIFSVDAGSGKVTRVGNETGGGLIRTPRNFALDPSASFLLVANQDAANALVFRVNPNNGTLSRVGTPVPTAMRPSFVGIVPRP